MSVLIQSENLERYASQLFVAGVTGRRVTVNHIGYWLFSAVSRFDPVSIGFGGFKHFLGDGDDNAAKQKV